MSSIRPKRPSPPLEFLNELFVLDAEGGLLIRRIKRGSMMPGNLRPANDRQNAGNIAPPKHNTSGFKGVSRNSRSGMWHAQIKIHGKQTYLGRRATPEEAAELYREAARKHFGEYACTDAS